MIHSIDRDRWCVPIFSTYIFFVSISLFHSFTCSLVDCARLFSRWVLRKNEIQAKTILLCLLLYYYCCGKYTISGQKRAVEQPNDLLLPQSFLHLWFISTLRSLFKNCSNFIYYKWMLNDHSIHRRTRASYTYTYKINNVHWMVWNRCHYK